MRYLASPRLRLLASLWSLVLPWWCSSPGTSGATPSLESSPGHPRGPSETSAFSWILHFIVNHKYFKYKANNICCK
uniref:Secreted protein n=1 Tax=Nomascus leucogenys TaxID=61853 RepID=A0A2I3GR50_NOMLE